MYIKLRKVFVHTLLNHPVHHFSRWHYFKPIIYLHYNIKVNEIQQTKYVINNPSKDTRGLKKHRSFYEAAISIFC